MWYYACICVDVCTGVCTSCENPLSCGFWESSSGCQACLLNTFNLLSNLTGPLPNFLRKGLIEFDYTARLVSFKDPLIFTLNCCGGVSALLLYYLFIYFYLCICTEDPNSGLYACMVSTLPNEHCLQPLDPQNLKLGMIVQTCNPSS